MTKVMICGEASYLFTGYAVYTHEICKRLHKMGLDVIEFASYGSNQDPRSNLPWKFFGVLPENDQEKQTYESNPLNQFGAYKFEQAILQHKPDIIYEFRDPWMCFFQLNSPFRKCFNLVWMPTVDSEPQPDEWVSQYEQCDGIFTYTKWAEQHLRSRSNKIKFCGQASMGADFDLYKPLNQKEIRKQLGIRPDAFIIGTTMRNQKRKLFPNLIQAFDLLMNKDSTIRERTYLYLHTSWPDMGWNIPELVKNSKYPHRILFTYQCQNCGAIYSTTFNEALSVCKACGALAAVLPSSSKGVPKEALACIYNTFDLFVQYANSEGLGAPTIEAAACEVPVMGTDYSAMVSTIRDCGGYPIEVKSRHLDCEKQTYFAIPNNEDLVDKIRKFYYLPEHEKIRKRKKARAGAIEHYNYDKAAANLYKYFVNAPKGKWNAPPDIRPCNPPVPPNLDMASLVEWAILNILGKPELIGSYFHLKTLRDLQNQSKLGNFGGPTANEMASIGYRTNAMPYGPNEMLNEFAAIRDNINQWEQRRIQDVG